MNRISKELKAMADAHIEARMLDKFDNPVVRTREELLEQLRAGKTFEEVMYQIEVRYMPVGAALIGIHIGHISQTYRKATYKAFKDLFKA